VPYPAELQLPLCDKLRGKYQPVYVALFVANIQSKAVIVPWFGARMMPISIRDGTNLYIGISARGMNGYRCSSAFAIASNVVYKNISG
jgi:hypothetical protein